MCARIYARACVYVLLNIRTQDQRNTGPPAKERNNSNTEEPAHIGIFASNEKK